MSNVVRSDLRGEVCLKPDTGIAYMLAACEVILKGSVGCIVKGESLR